MYTLVACPGTGSAIAEAALSLAGLPFTIREADPWNAEEDRAFLRSLNPLGQLPVLVLPDGAVMTESAAIVLHAAEETPASRLAPTPGSPARAGFLRWLEYLVASIYPTFTFGDEPGRWVPGDEAAAALRRRTDEYRQFLWQVMEAGIGPGPWVLGADFSALDIYVSVMTRWRPRRDWFKEACPRLHGIAAAVDRMPSLAPVWARNFPQAG